MLSKKHILLLFLFSISIIIHAQTAEVKYYNLVIDKLELPSFSKDTTATGWVRINIRYDDDRVVDHWEYVTISAKSPVIAINKKMVDIKREDKISFWMKFTETGGKKPEGVDIFGNPYTANNLSLEYESKFSAISEGRRQFLNTFKFSNWDYFAKDRNEKPAVILHWHLEPNKLL